MCLLWPPVHTARDLLARRMLPGISTPGLCRSPSTRRRLVLLAQRATLDSCPSAAHGICCDIICGVQGCMMVAHRREGMPHVSMGEEQIGCLYPVGGPKQCPDTLRCGVPGEKIRAPEGCACAPAQCTVPGTTQLCCSPGKGPHRLCWLLSILSAHCC